MNYIICHGSFGAPFDHWFSWAAEMLGKEQTIVPQFPIGVGHQTYENWASVLDCYRNLGYIHENSVLIGHSIAPIFLIRYLLEHNLQVKKLFFISGFNHYSVDQGGVYDQVNESFFVNSPEKIKNHAKEIVCFYSHNDPYVSIDALTKFASLVATKTIVVQDAGHFNSESGYFIFERLLEEIHKS